MTKQITCKCGSLSVMRHGRLILVLPNVTNVAVRSLCVTKMCDLDNATEIKKKIEFHILQCYQ